jgi:hypothetical protein
MTLLLRDPDVKAEQAAAAPAPDAPPESRPCPNCQAPMAPGQDWCLACGQAAPGRLGGRPGGRAAATVAALTLALCGGAVAASYAALQDDGPAPKPAPANGAQVAQAPQPAPPAPTTATPPAATPPATPPASSTPATPPAAPPSSSKKPSTPPATPPAASSKPATPAPSTTTKPSTSTGSTTGSGSGSIRTTPTPAKPAAPEPITLQGADVATYDPYSRATSKNDASRAVDGDTATSWFATVPAGSGSIGVGLVVDLGKLRGIRELELTTKTPGFRTEIYATDSSDLPPDVLDTRWAHLKDASDVGSSGSAETIVIGGGSTKYRHLLLWFTAPPKDGTTVRVTELQVLG